ncbi:MAG: TolC family protein [Candidatus Brocadiia bacterium]
MMKRTAPLAAVCMAVLLLAGCASVSTDATWDEVQADVAERTGRIARWHRGTRADQAVSAAVERMLQEGLTAEEAVQIALVNNRDLQATYEQLGIAQADLVQAGLLENPVFEGAFRFVRDDGQAYDLGVTQHFLDVLLIPMRKKVAASQLERTKMAVTAGVMDLVADVQVGTVRAQAARQVLAMRQEVLEAAEASYEMAQRLREAGNVTELQLSLERELYEESKLDVQAAELAAVEAREELNILLGLWGRNTDWELAGDLPEIPGQEMDLSEAESRAVRNSVDLAMAWEELRTAASAMGVSWAETVSPELAAGIEAEGEDPGVWEVGPALALPIPLFDRGQAASARAEAEMRRLWNRYTDLAVRLRSETRMARYRLQAARQRAVYYRDVVMPLREQILRQTQLRYNAMFLGVFELLQAKQLETDARRRYIEALGNYWIVRAEMETLLRGRMIADSAASMGPGGGTAAGRRGGGGH